MIRISNIYYMLAYAFQALQEKNYKSLAAEDFHNTAELCAAILVKGISTQLKRGLGREYLPISEALSTLQGKIDISSSLKDQTILKKQLICSYDTFSVNTELNRIIKSTAMLLMKSDIARTRKKELRNLLLYFTEVEEIDLHTVQWNRSYNRGNQTYQMLISICYLAYKGLIQTQRAGRQKMMDFIDEQRMCRLYEKFILEYYRKEHPEFNASAAQIPWQLDDDMDDMLPRMRTDIMLKRGNRILIIDAKYYSHTTQTQYEVNTIHSGNLYQIFTYVKNKEYELRDQPHTVSGMLLYAQTDESVLPNNDYRMSGNRISIHTLDLSGDFSAIRKQLDSFVIDL